MPMRTGKSSVGLPDSLSSKNNAVANFTENMLEVNKAALCD